MNLIARITKSKLLLIAASAAAIATWLKIALDKLERNHNDMWE